MAKILTTDELIEAAEANTFPGSAALIEDIVEAVDNLAQAMADYYEIVKGGTTWEGKAYAGLATSFYAKDKDQLCPEPINFGDPGGDWEVKPEL